MTKTKPKLKPGDFVVTMYTPGGDAVEGVRSGDETVGRLLKHRIKRPSSSSALPIYTAIWLSKKAFQRFHLQTGAFDRIFYTAWPVRELTLSEYLALKQIGEIDDDES